MVYYCQFWHIQPSDNQKLPPTTHQYVQSPDSKGTEERRRTMNYQVTHSQRPLNFEIDEVMNMKNINEFLRNARITQERTSPVYNVCIQYMYTSNHKTKHKNYTDIDTWITTEEDSQSKP